MRKAIIVLFVFIIVCCSGCLSLTIPGFGGLKVDNPLTPLAPTPRELTYKGPADEEVYFYFSGGSLTPMSQAKTLFGKLKDKYNEYKEKKDSEKNSKVNDEILEVEEEVTPPNN